MCTTTTRVFQCQILVLVMCINLVDLDFADEVASTYALDQLVNLTAERLRFVYHRQSTPTNSMVIRTDKCFDLAQASQTAKDKTT